jgi:Transcriptional regulator, AbiEi antitoxin
MNPDELCFQIASTQHGLITYRQIRECGMSRQMLARRLGQGRLTRTLPAVYRVAGVPETFFQRAMGAQLWMGGACALSHDTAAHLLGLSTAQPELIEISTLKARQSRIDGLVVHEVQRLLPEEIAPVGGIQTTNVERTLLDLASRLSRIALERAIDDALHRRMTTLDRLMREVDVCGGPGKTGTVALRRLLSGRAPQESAAESPLEMKLMRLLASHGFPPGIPQYEICDEGRVLARVDLAYPDKRLAIEADGYRFHSNSFDWHRDQVRFNSLVTVNWRLLRFTNEDARRPGRFLHEFRRALSAPSHA